MSINNELLIDNYSNKRTNTALNYFWLGFAIYMLSETISFGIPENIKLTQLFQVFGILLFVPSAMILIQFKFENSYLRIIFIIYCLWLLVTILRGLQLDYKSLKSTLFSSWSGIFLYFVPLVLCFPKNLIYLKRTFDTIVIFAFFFILFCLFFRKDLLYSYGDNDISKNIALYFTTNLGIPSGFILLTYVYHSNRRKLFALFLIILILLLAAIRARRASIFMSMSILCVFYYIYYYANKKKVLYILLSFFLIPIIIAGGITIFNQNKKHLFHFLTERGNEDTRTLVEIYFYQDMKTSKDLIFGRGMNGEYFCPNIEENDNSGYRDIIETGFLQIILNGGLISLVLLLLIAIPAVFKGLFYSKNVLSKAAGLWILLFLIFSYPILIVTFTMNYLLFWISIGICYSGKIRIMSDNNIKEIFST